LAEGLSLARSGCKNLFDGISAVDLFRELGDGSTTPTSGFHLDRSANSSDEKGRPSRGHYLGPGSMGLVFGLFAERSACFNLAQRNAALRQKSIPTEALIAENRRLSNLVAEMDRWSAGRRGQRSR
jgi:hypothetical protein